MSDFHQTGVITALHRLGPTDLGRLEAELLEYSAERPIALDPKAEQALDPVSRRILSELTPQLQNASWERDKLEAVIADTAGTHGIGLGKIAGPLRAALTGRTVTPSVFDMMLVLGREETLARLTDAAD